MQPCEAYEYFLSGYATIHIAQLVPFFIYKVEEDADITEVSKSWLVFAGNEQKRLLAQKLLALPQSYVRALVFLNVRKLSNGDDSYFRLIYCIFLSIKQFLFRKKSVLVCGPHGMLCFGLGILH